MVYSFLLSKSTCVLHCTVQCTTDIWTFLHVCFNQILIVHKCNIHIQSCVCSAAYTKVQYMEHYQFPPAYLKQAIMVYSPPPPLPLLIFTIVVEDCLVNMTCASNHQVQNKTLKELPLDHSDFLWFLTKHLPIFRQFHKLLFFFSRNIFSSNCFPPPTFYFLIRFFQ